MANWCSNTIEFTSGNFLSFKQEIVNHSGKNNGLHIIDEDSMCIFSVQGTMEDDYINFESRWAPPLEDLVKRAIFDGFEFKIDYYEPGCCIYGKAEFVDKWFNVKDLPMSVFESIVYDENGDATVEGDDIDCVEEYLEEQLSLIF